MNLKFAHLVAIQLGIFIGVASCLLFLRFDSPEPRTAAEVRELAAEFAAAIKEQRTDLADDRAGSEPDQLTPGQLAPAVPNEYSPEAVEQYRALATKLYYEQIAPRRNASATLTRSSTAPVVPSSPEVVAESAVYQTYDPAPEPVAYVEPPQVVVYQPVQYIAYSHPSRFANRCRPAPHHGVVESTPHPRPHRRGNHLNSSAGFVSPRSFGVVHRRNTGVASCPPTQGFRPRGKR